ncbi:hypothetical protein HDK77DRAFT_77264 [Phyllosticta capitalensis]
MLLPRQTNAPTNNNNNDGIVLEDDSRFDNFWFTRTGFIVKFTIFGVLVLFFLLWFVGGYYHAQRRMKKGLAPLPYHRWLLPSHQRARFEPYVREDYTFYRPNPQYQGHNMQPYQEPLPLYNNDVPPTYQPPAGSTKVAPEQHYGPPPTSYSPPPGPPPSSGQTTGVVDEPTQPAQAHSTGGSNPWRL